MTETKTAPNFSQDTRSVLIKASKLRWIHWLVIIASFVLTIAVWKYSDVQAEQKLENRFNSESAKLVDMVLERMEFYEHALWGGVAHLDVTDGQTSAAHWQRYANSLRIDQTYLGINGIGVIYNIQKNELAAYLQQQTSERPGYGIHPSHQQDEYWPITYIEPVSTNKKAVGLDMAFETNRYTGIKKARDTGLAQLTGPITLVQDAKKTPGFLLYAPFYQKGQLLETIEQRRQAIIGVTYAPFIMYKLMDGALSQQKRLVSIKITDTGDLLYDDADNRVDSLIDPNPMYTKAIAKELYGRTWTFELQSNLQFRSTLDVNQSHYILAAGILIQLFIIILFIVLTSANRKALAYADEMTEALQRKANDLQNINKELKITNLSAQQAAQKLIEQQFALDQHAIVSMTDIKGDITYANDKFCKISGFSREELLGKNHRMVNSGVHDKLFFKNLYKTIGSGQVWHNEVCNKAKNGDLYWVDATVVPLMDDGKPTSYIAIRTDITELKEQETALIEAKEAAEAATRAKSEFLASMSHEIRTPMNGVMGMLNLVLHSELNNDQRHQISVAQSSANALLTLINDILDFSKIDAGKMEIEQLDFNLRAMLGEFAEGIALAAQDKGLEVILDMTNIEHSMIKSDPGRIRQILTNLVGNAIKFTEQGEIVIRVALLPESQSTNATNTTNATENYLRMTASIEDTGIGIPPAKISSLFDSFSQVDASTTRKYGGTGLGLAIAKKLTELMGGGINVSSTQGKGSCFEFNIRVEASELSQMVLPKVNIDTLNLLIVDDNATNLEVLKGQLSHWGAKVVEADSAQAAIAMCEQRAQEPNLPFFDIALLDMQMPEMDGAALGKYLQAEPRFKSMKLVMMTSMGSRGDGQFFADIGFSAYFPKPMTTSDLFDALSVVADAGDVMKHAKPLVTHHFLQTLAHEKPEALNWPEHTRLLLVEDNRVNQMVAQGVLKKMGLTADIAANGLEALEALSTAPENAPYTAIIMDCQMPEMDGYEASQKIRDGKAGQRYLKIPIIAMTANAMQGDKEKCLAAGMDDYITKPIDPQKLLKTLIQWLSRVADIKEEQPEVAGQQGVPQYSSSSPIEVSSEPVFDYPAFSARMMADKDLINIVADAFLGDMPVQIEQLKAAIMADDPKQAGAKAHQIKGAAANVGAMALSEIAKAMEQAGIAEDIASVRQAMPLLEQRFEDVKAAMAEVLR